MGNILDYLDWRGDLTFEQDPFNEVDSLVLCQLSYLHLDGIVPEQGAGVSVRAAAKRFAEEHENSQDGGAPGGLVSPLTPQILEKMAASRRFAEAKLFHYVEHLDDEAGEQFSALSVKLPGNVTYVAFRGTDDTFAGWREDFAMSYAVVGAQQRALEYLEQTRKTTRGKIHVGGHSKGGNLAVYAAATCGRRARKRIEAVWVHDGPGFGEGTTPAKELEAITPLVHRYVPEFCVVGQLMDQPYPYEVVASATSGIMQHSATNWQVRGNRFERRAEIDPGAARFGKVFREAISGKDAEFCRRLTCGLFDALEAGGKTMGELSDGAPASYLRVALAYASIEADIRGAVEEVVGSLVGESVTKGISDASASAAGVVAGLFGKK